MNPDGIEEEEGLALYFFNNQTFNTFEEEHPQPELYEQTFDFKKSNTSIGQIPQGLINHVRQMNINQPQQVPAWQN